MWPLGTRRMEGQGRRSVSNAIQEFAGHHPQPGRDGRLDELDLFVSPSASGSFVTHDDMVVKALSWALRERTRHDPSAVAGFVDRHSTDIAPRVRRDVMHKLTTGVKSRWQQGRPAGRRLG